MGISAYLSIKKNKSISCFKPLDNIKQGRNLPQAMNSYAKPVFKGAVKMEEELLLKLKGDS